MDISLQLAETSVNGIDLEALGKQQLIDIVRNLNQTISKLQADYKKIINLRLRNLERNINLSPQYLRRDTLKINGIPNYVSVDEIEDEVIQIFKDAKVNVNRQNIKKSDIQTADRKGRKGTVTVKVVNWKFVRAALLKKSNLKASKMYGDRTDLTLFRCTHKEYKMYKYKVRNWFNFVQLEENGKFIEIPPKQGS